MMMPSINNIWQDWLMLSAALYLTTEVIFYAIFHLYLVPRANRRTPPHPYRYFGRNRHALLVRIIKRIEWMSGKAGLHVRHVLARYLLEWFQPIKNNNNSTSSSSSSNSSRLHPPMLHPPMLQHVGESSMMSSSSTSSCEETSSSASSDATETDTEDDETVLVKEVSKEHWTVAGLGKDDMDSFAAWAFFGKELNALEEWEVVELRKCYHQIQRGQGLVFEPGSANLYQPRRLTLEDVNPLHRPLLVYVVVVVMKIVAGWLLRLAGYQRVVSKQTGLVGWYKPARDQHGQLLPYLFFHGIAPAGLVFYLPMILAGLAVDDRAVFMFENRSISCALGWNALTEEETVTGCQEIVNRFIDPNTKLSVIGHSFGSCQLTWLLHSEHFRDRIRQFVLMDPVTILLSEPDVMTNFLYAKSLSKLRMLASSELFTEYYLRRHFSWYNSELWLEDLPDSVYTLIALAANDEIVNSPKVKREIDMYVSEHDSDSCCIETIYWHAVGHASCVTSPSKWRDIRTRLLQQELALQQQQEEKASS